MVISHWSGEPGSERTRVPGSPRCDRCPICHCNGQIRSSIFSSEEKNGGEGGIDSLRSGLRPKACGFALILLSQPLRACTGFAGSPCACGTWRRGRDSNPRDLAAHRISSAARSTTLPPLRDHPPSSPQSRDFGGHRGQKVGAPLENGSRKLVSVGGQFGVGRALCPTSNRGMSGINPDLQNPFLSGQPNRPTTLVSVSAHS
jgi:hypothetical protein